MVLGLEYVDGAQPAPPVAASRTSTPAWTMTEQMAADLTPAPEGLDLDTFADGVRRLAAVLGPRPGRPSPTCPHLEEAAALAARFAEVTAGRTLVHTDMRDDNFLIGRDGQVLLCDWNWPVVGADWLDTLFLLIGPRGDGLDVEPVLADRPLLRDVPAEPIDSGARAARGLLLPPARRAGAADLAVPPRHQSWQGEVCWAWLCERRGWV